MTEAEPTETIEAPEIPIEQLTTEQILSGGDPEMEERFRQAARGKYEHTLIEIWGDDLSRELEGYAAQASMDTYEQFVRSWPWLKYSDVDACRKAMLKLTQESQDAMDDAVQAILAKTDRTYEELLGSQETDWPDNKEIYLEIVARWSALMTSWGQWWAHSSMTVKPVLHASIAIACARLIGQHGLVEQMKNLANFESSNEDQEALGARIAQLIEETGRE